MDTNDNAADFVSGAPTPRNRSTPRASCVAEPFPQISLAGVVNGASFVGGRVAPGEIITIFGAGLGPISLATLQLNFDRQSLTTSLAGTRVLFDGVAAPMLYTIGGQVSAIVPFNVTDRTTVEVQVEFNSRASNRISLPTSAAAPAFFTIDATGRGLAAALNQSGQVNSSFTPSSGGQVIVLFATGVGQTSPTSIDGRIQSGPAGQLYPVSFRIGGLDAEILYAGPAPGVVSGVTQINAKIPVTLASGPQLVELRVAGQTSQSGVFVHIGL